MNGRSTAVDEDLVREVTRIVVSEVAPQEMVVFGINSRAYFRDPAGTLKAAAGDGGGSQERMMGAGGAEVVVLLTPFALAMVQGALSSFIGAFAANLADGSGTAVRTWLSGLFGRGGGDTDTEPESALTPDQVEWLREEAYRTALRAQVEESRARLLADALAGAARVRR